MARVHPLPSDRQEQRPGLTVTAGREGPAREGARVPAEAGGKEPGRGRTSWSGSQLDPELFQAQRPSHLLLQQRAGLLQSLVLHG